MRDIFYLLGGLGLFFLGLAAVFVVLIVAKIVGKISFAQGALDAAEEQIELYEKVINEHAAKCTCNHAAPVEL